MGFSGNKLAFMNSGHEDAREKLTPRDEQKGAPQPPTLAVQSVVMLEVPTGPGEMAHKLRQQSGSQHLDEY